MKESKETKTKAETEEYFLLLTEKRNSLNNELQDTAFAIADLGKKMYELKEELRIVLIKLEKCTPFYQKRNIH